MKTLSALFNKGMQAKVERQALASASLGEEMSLVSHIVELRRHLVRALLYFLGFTILCIAFMKPLIRFLRAPYEAYMIEKKLDPSLVSLDMFEVILMNFKICFVVGLVLAAPFMVRELWRFVAPALYDHEKKLAVPLVGSSIALFYAGITFGFFVIVPAFLGNTLDWAADFDVKVTLSFENYFSSLSMMVMIFGIIFEVPVVMSLLGMVGILNSEMLARNRRMVILVSFIIGAVVSPPDVVSQFIVSLPLYGMVEISILALRILEKRRAKALAELEAKERAEEDAQRRKAAPEPEREPAPEPSHADESSESPGAGEGADGAQRGNAEADGSKEPKGNPDDVTRGEG
jgi:sec-independent protein translocase protein TatC